MKKFIAITMIMMVSLVGCGGNTSSSSTENEVNSQVSTDIIVKAATDVTVNTNEDTKVNTADAAIDTTTNTNVETKVNAVETTAENTVDNTVDNRANTNTDTAVTSQEETTGIKAGQTLNEYLATENKTPRYFYINPFSEDWEELVELYPEVLLEIKTIFVYFGETYPFPFPGDEVIAIPINFGDEIWEMTNEDLIYAINSYQIAEVIEVPDLLTTIISKYTDLEVDITSVAEDGRIYDDYGMLTLRGHIIKYEEGKEPKYFIYDTSAGAFKELTEENKMMFYDTGVICVYFGTNAMPDDYEEVAMIMPFWDRSLEEMSLEEVIETIKDSGGMAWQTFMDVAMNY